MAAAAALWLPFEARSAMWLWRRSEAGREHVVPKPDRGGKHRTVKIRTNKKQIASSKILSKCGRYYLLYLLTT